MLGGFMYKMTSLFQDRNTVMEFVQFIEYTCFKKIIKF